MHDHDLSLELIEVNGVSDILSMTKLKEVVLLFVFCAVFYLPSFVSVCIANLSATKICMVSHSITRDTYTGDCSSPGSQQNHGVVPAL